MTTEAPRKRPYKPHIQFKATVELIPVPLPPEKVLPYRQALWFLAWRTARRLGMDEMALNFEQALEGSIWQPYIQKEKGETHGREATV
jgi:hypothetical protein